MEDTNNGGEKGKARRWIFSDFIRKGVHYALILSLGIFTVYTVGSIPDPGLSDRILFFLLKVLRYTSLINCAFSLFALGFSVHKLVYYPHPRHILSLCFYFITALVGAILSMLDSLMLAASEGNI